MLIFLLCPTFQPNDIFSDCASPGALGLEDGSIKDVQLDATSSSSGHNQQYGRLNYDNTFNGWLHENSDTDPWFEVNFYRDALISGVATQGGSQTSGDSWMETFEMSYSIDGTVFLFYKFANETKVRRTFKARLAALTSNCSQTGDMLENFVVFSSHG